MDIDSAEYEALTSSSGSPNATLGDYFKSPEAREPAQPESSKEPAGDEAGQRAEPAEGTRENRERQE
jgi:hypothetical protein